MNFLWLNKSHLLHSCVGIGGNLVSIQASRISTSLHLNCLPGEVPEDRRRCYSPCRTFFGSGKNEKSEMRLKLLTKKKSALPSGHAHHTHTLMVIFDVAGPNHRSAQVLLLLLIPGQLIFLTAIHLMKGGNTLPSALLTIAFLSASLIQVSQIH